MNRFVVTSTVQRISDPSFLRRRLIVPISSLAESNALPH
jgi:hypothetical protein